MTSAAFLNSLTFVEQQFMPELGLKKKKKNSKGHCQIKIKAVLLQNTQSSPTRPFPRLQYYWLKYIDTGIRIHIYLNHFS